MTRLRLALALGALAVGCASEPPEASPGREPFEPEGEAPAEVDAAGDDDPLDAGPAPGDAEAPPRYVDTCDLGASACTAAPSGFKEGAGLTAVDRCAFALVESAGLGSVPPLVTALAKLAERVTFADLLADANRTGAETTSVPGAPAGVAYAFRWQSDDANSTAWIPQGITGTMDADASGNVDGRRAVLASFYHAPPAGQPNKGVRIAFVDLKTPQPKYRFALLVEPKGTPAAPSFDPVRIHAGGIAWFGDYLYVADTSRGLRVFDMRHILRVATDEDVIGCAGGTCRAGTYKYVLPQVGKYAVASACKPLFSFVSLDRKSDPPALVSGEYCSTTACAGPLAGRVFRWPLDPATGLLRSQTTFPTEAHLMSHKQVQGAATVGDAYYLSSSAPPAGRGELYRLAGKKSATSGWSDSPEDLMVDHAMGWLWSQSEEAGARAVFAAKLASYPKP